MSSTSSARSRGSLTPVESIEGDLVSKDARSKPRRTSKGSVHQIVVKETQPESVDETIDVPEDPSYQEQEKSEELEGPDVQGPEANGDLGEHVSQKPDVKGDIEEPAFQHPETEENAEKFASKELETNEKLKEFAFQEIKTKEKVEKPVSQELETIDISEKPASTTIERNNEVLFDEDRATGDNGSEVGSVGSLAIAVRQTNATEGALLMGSGENVKEKESSEAPHNKSDEATVARIGVGNGVDDASNKDFVEASVTSISRTAASGTHECSRGADLLPSQNEQTLNEVNRVEEIFTQDVKDSTREEKLPSEKVEEINCPEHEFKPQSVKDDQGEDAGLNGVRDLESGRPVSGEQRKSMEIAPVLENKTNHSKNSPGSSRSNLSLASSHETLVDVLAVKSLTEDPKIYGTLATTPALKTQDAQGLEKEAETKNTEEKKLKASKGDNHAMDGLDRLDSVEYSYFAMFQSNSDFFNESVFEDSVYQKEDTIQSKEQLQEECNHSFDKEPNKTGNSPVEDMTYSSADPISDRPRLVPDTDERDEETMLNDRSSHPSVSNEEKPEVQYVASCTERQNVENNDSGPTRANEGGDNRVDPDNKDRNPHVPRDNYVLNHGDGSAAPQNSLSRVVTQSDPELEPHDSPPVNGCVAESTKEEIISSLETRSRDKDEPMNGGGDNRRQTRERAGSLSEPAEQTISRTRDDSSTSGGDNEVEANARRDSGTESDSGEEPNNNSGVPVSATSSDHGEEEANMESNSSKTRRSVSPRKIPKRHSPRRISPSVPSCKPSMMTYQSVEEMKAIDRLRLGPYSERITLTSPKISVRTKPGLSKTAKGKKHKKTKKTDVAVAPKHENEGRGEGGCEGASGEGGGDGGGVNGGGGGPGERGTVKGGTGDSKASAKNNREEAGRQTKKAKLITPKSNVVRPVEKKALHTTVEKSNKNTEQRKSALKVRPAKPKPPKALTPNSEVPAVDKDVNGSTEDNGRTNDNGSMQSNGKTQDNRHTVEREKKSEPNGKATFISTEREHSGRKRGASAREKEDGHSEPQSRIDDPSDEKAVQMKSVEDVEPHAEPENNVQSTEDPKQVPVLSDFDEAAENRLKDSVTVSLEVEGPPNNETEQRNNSKKENKINNNGQKKGFFSKFFSKEKKKKIIVTSPKRSEKLAAQYANNHSSTNLSSSTSSKDIIITTTPSEHVSSTKNDEGTDLKPELKESSATFTVVDETLDADPKSEQPVAGRIVLNSIKRKLKEKKASSASLPLHGRTRSPSPDKAAASFGSTGSKLGSSGGSSLSNGGHTAHKTQSMSSLKVPGPSATPTPWDPPVEEDAISLYSRRDSARPSIDSRKSVDIRLQTTTTVVVPVAVDEKAKSVLANDEAWIGNCIPNMPLSLAVVCLLMNIVIPGSGTALSGISILCCGQARVTNKDDSLLMTLCANVLVGLAQLFTVTFMLVGWFWSIGWGIKMVAISACPFETNATMGNKGYPAWAFFRFASVENSWLDRQTGIQTTVSLMWTNRQGDADSLEALL